MQARNLSAAVDQLATVWRLVRAAGLMLIAGIVELGLLVSDQPRWTLLFPPLAAAWALLRALRPAKTTAVGAVPTDTSYLATRRTLPMTWTAQALVPLGPVGRLEIAWPTGRLDVAEGRAVLSRQTPAQLDGPEAGQVAGPWEFTPGPQTSIVPVLAAGVQGGVAFRVEGARDVLVFTQQRDDVLATLATAGFTVQQSEETLSVGQTLFG